MGKRKVYKMSIYSEAKEYFSAHKEEIVADIARLVSMPSVLSSPEKDAPNGKACKDMLVGVCEFFRESGYEAKISDDNLYALIRHGDGEKTIGIFAHGDVVPVDDKWEVTAPFEPKVYKEWIFGRGVVDNKNAIAFSVWFLRFLREHNIKMKNTLQIFIGSNEEAGMNDIEAFAENEKMPELCIVPDNDYPVSLGEKGRSVLWCESDKSFCNIIDIYGGRALNVLLGEVTAELGYTDALYREIREKADGRYDITLDGDKIKIVAKGLAAHAAHPEKGQNATGVLCELLLKCKELCANDREILEGASKILATTNASDFESRCDDAIFGTSTCANGVVCVENGRLRLSYDIRYGISLLPSVLRENAERVLSSISWHIYSFHGASGFEIPKDNKFAVAIRDFYREASGDASADFYYSGGGTYARHLENGFSIGMSNNCLHRCTTLPEGHGHEHQPDECLHIDGYINAMSINAHILLKCDEIL